MNKISIEINEDSGIFTRTRSSTLESRASECTLASLAFSLPRSDRCFFDLTIEMRRKIEDRQRRKEADLDLDGMVEFFEMAEKEARKEEREMIWRKMKLEEDIGGTFVKLSSARSKRWSSSRLTTSERKKLFKEHVPTNKNRSRLYFNGQLDAEKDLYAPGFQKFLSYEFFQHLFSHTDIFLSIDLFIGIYGGL